MLISARHGIEDALGIAERGAQSRGYVFPQGMADELLQLHNALSRVIERIEETCFPVDGQQP
jgi:hypothetical protein